MDNKNINKILIANNILIRLSINFPDNHMYKKYSYNILKSYIKDYITKPSSKTLSGI